MTDKTLPAPLRFSAKPSWLPQGATEWETQQAAVLYHRTHRASRKLAELSTNMAEALSGDGDSMDHLSSFAGHNIGGLAGDLIEGLAAIQAFRDGITHRLASDEIRAKEAVQ